MIEITNETICIKNSKGEIELLVYKYKEQLNGMMQIHLETKTDVYDGPAQLLLKNN